MVSSLIVAGYFGLLHDDLGFLPMLSWQKLIIGVGITTLIWFIATYFTPATEISTLRKFYRLIRPGGAGWGVVIREAKADGDHLPGGSGQLFTELKAVLLGCVMVYALLFAAGFLIYGQTTTGIITT